MNMLHSSENTLRNEYIAMCSSLPKIFDKITFPGFSRSEFMMVHTIIAKGDDKKGLRVSDLASHLEVSTPAVSRMIKSLVDKGYVLKVHDEADRRITYVSLTESGHEKSCECAKKLIGIVDRTIDLMGEEDVRELIRLSNKLFEYFDEQLTNHPM